LADLLGYEEAVHVVHMGVNSLRKLQTRMESLFFERRQTGQTNFKSSFYKFYEAVLESVIDHPLVFFNRD